MRRDAFATRTSSNKSQSFVAAILRKPRLDGGRSPEIFAAEGDKGVKKSFVSSRSDAECPTAAGL
jgi:hypothetical protein